MLNSVQNLNNEPLVIDIKTLKSFYCVFTSNQRGGIKELINEETL